MTIQLLNDAIYILFSGFVLATLSYTAIRKQEFFLGFLLTYFALFSSVFLFPFIAVKAEFSGLNIYISDVLTLVLLIATLQFSIKIVPKASLTSNIPMAFKYLILSVILGVLFWIADTSLKTSWNNWRAFTFSFALFIYAYKINLSKNILQISKYLSIPGYLLLVLVLIAFILRGPGRTDGIDPLTGLEAGRATTAAGGLQLLLLFLTLLFTLRIRGKTIFILFVLLAALLLLQHRSVWVALIISMIYWFAAGTKHTLIFKFLTFLVSGILISFASTVYRQLSEASTNDEPLSGDSTGGGGVFKLRELWENGSLGEFSVRPLCKLKKLVTSAYSHTTYM